MEKVADLNVTVRLILFSSGWSDMGTFNAIYYFETKSKEDNIFKGDEVSLNSSNNIAISSKKNISLLGVII